MTSGSSNADITQIRAVPWQQKAAASAAREVSLSRILTTYVAIGMVFMVLPGTFLGVWNLISISGSHSPDSLAPGWIQAHGHAQIFGWIGTFILGIGFYSIPKLRNKTRVSNWEPWICLALWTTGVAMRWFAGVYELSWRLLLPASAILELIAFLIFFRLVASHRPVSVRHERAGRDSSQLTPPQHEGAPGNDRKPSAWIIVVIGGTAGLLLALVLNVVECIYLALKGTSPAFPREFDLRFLSLSTWGFIVPFVWGFTSRWMPAFLGLRPSSGRLLITAFLLNLGGVALAVLGLHYISALVLLLGTAVSLTALQLFGRTRHAAKTRTVSAWFPAFVRIAFIWSVIAASLGVWASLAEHSAGIAGASRHALTVGFISIMVFSVGPRVLPAFCGLRVLFSAKLMTAALAFLTAGCTIRVVSEVVAYQRYAEWGWDLLPVSALIEMTAVTLFALNMVATLLRPPLVPPAAVQGAIIG
jgi:hypothetical protein